MSNKIQNIEPDWQNKLLPFLKWTIIIASFACFALVSISMWSIYKFVEYEDKSVIDSYLNNSNSSDPSLDVIKAMAKLDEYSLHRRHHFARIGILSSTSIKYMGFIIGFVVCLFGAIFVLGKINIEKETNIEIESKSFGKLSLQSTSPGLIMIILGIALIGWISRIKHQDIITDGSTYLPGWEFPSKTIEKNTSDEEPVNPYDYE